jgi:hypothetical protein
MEFEVDLFCSAEFLPQWKSASFEKGVLFGGFLFGRLSLPSGRFLKSIYYEASCFGGLWSVIRFKPLRRWM